MDAGAKFGLLFWSLQVIELTIYTTVVWHRTHLAISVGMGLKDILLLRRGECQTDAVRS